MYSVQWSQCSAHWLIEFVTVFCSLTHWVRDSVLLIVLVSLVTVPLHPTKCLYIRSASTYGDQRHCYLSCDHWVRDIEVTHFTLSSWHWSDYCHPSSQFSLHSACHSASTYGLQCHELNEAVRLDINSASLHSACHSASTYGHVFTCRGTVTHWVRDIEVHMDTCSYVEELWQCIVTVRLDINTCPYALQCHELNEAVRLDINSASCHSACHSASTYEHCPHIWTLPLHMNTAPTYEHCPYIWRMPLRMSAFT